MLEKFNKKARNKISNIKNRVFPGAIILMYHRVAEADSDPWSLCVTPKHFAEHLEVLQKYGNLIHLQELKKRLGNRQSINRSIVITFDDGYVDNLYNAKPLLEKYDVPATVFITTGGIDQKQEFWWDDLDRLLLQPGTLPDLFQLNINNQIHQWELGEATSYSKEAFERDQSWRMECLEDPTPRHTLYRYLYQQLQFLPVYERKKCLDKICVWAKAEPIGRLTHRSLSHQEIFELESGGLIEIGSHTVNHPFLSDISIDSQQTEIKQSKHSLEQLLGHSITSFSYPNGSYGIETPSIVKEAGFNCACCSIANPVKKNSNDFLLPRFVVEDWDGETFARWLSRYF